MTTELTIPVGGRLVDEFTLDYEGFWSLGAHCDVKVVKDDAGVTALVLTDQSHVHGNTSVTNRIERVCFLAWQEAGKPSPCAFVERYPDHPQDLDIVTFRMGPDGSPARVPFHFRGQPPCYEFHEPNWRRLPGDALPEVRR